MKENDIIQQAYRELDKASSTAASAFGQPSGRQLVWLTQAKDIIAPLLERAYRQGMEDGKGDEWERGYTAGVQRATGTVLSAVNNAVIECMKEGGR